jgi:aspartyl-tRNA synthetase
MLRNTNAGALRLSDVGSQVKLAGWVGKRRDHGGIAFLDLRDSTGTVQVVVRDESVAGELRSEFCLQILGTVQARPEGNDNSVIATGDVEVIADSVVVLSKSAPLPFPIDDAITVGEETRLKYRYLDLRRPTAGNILRMRSDVNRMAREVLHERNFVEIETPTLTRSTPEGARDFLVPVRLQPGHWYALPQSPQLFKQLLMVGGMERYYQIARCYRDEDFRKDRQPEFTQLDIEMSFVEQEDILEVGEAIVRKLWHGTLGLEIGDIPRMTFFEAMDRYGSDKPDLRFDIELKDCTEYFKDTEFRVFQNEFVGAVVMPGGADQPRRTFDAWQEWAKQRGAKGLAYVTFDPDGTLGGPVAKNLTDAERDGLAKHIGAKPGDCAFFGAGAKSSTQQLLGAVRQEVGERCGLIDENQWSFLWIVDAPMFEKTDDGGWTAVHHPFTSPNAQWVDRFEEAPDQALAWAYDIVCNGNEIGGGSIRIHRSDVQQRVFTLLGLSKEETQDKFGFLLDAFAFGPPPHGGIAFGWDRICMLLSGATSLRDVIAFPKTGAGFDPLTSAPTSITAQQRLEAGIDADPDAQVASND